MRGFYLGMTVVLLLAAVMFSPVIALVWVMVASIFASW